MISFVRYGIQNVVHFNSKFNSERMWHYLHLDHGCIAIGNWYRSPSSGLEQIEELSNELAEIKQDVLGIILMGDMNIHHQSWLIYSSGDSPEGRRLKEIMEENGMLQLVRGPTRKENLLDLVLTNIDDCKASILEPIADHRAITATIKLPMPKEVVVQRDVWHFKQAAWKNMRCQLKNQCWARLKHGTVDDAVNYFVDLLTSVCSE